MSGFFLFLLLGILYGVAGFLSERGRPLMEVFYIEIVHGPVLGWLLSPMLRRSRSVALHKNAERFHFTERGGWTPVRSGLEYDRRRYFNGAT